MLIHSHQHLPADTALLFAWSLHQLGKAQNAMDTIQGPRDFLHLTSSKNLQRFNHPQCCPCTISISDTQRQWSCDSITWLNSIGRISFNDKAGTNCTLQQIEIEDLKGWGPNGIWLRGQTKEAKPGNYSHLENLIQASLMQGKSQWHVHNLSKNQRLHGRLPRISNYIAGVVTSNTTTNHVKASVCQGSSRTFLLQDGSCQSFCWLQTYTYRTSSPSIGRKAFKKIIVTKNRSSSITNELSWTLDRASQAFRIYWSRRQYLTPQMRPASCLMISWRQQDAMLVSSNTPGQRQPNPCLYSEDLLNALSVKKANKNPWESKIPCEMLRRNVNIRVQCSVGHQ
jgi:hypothetical protein